MQTRLDWMDLMTSLRVPEGKSNEVEISDIVVSEQEASFGRLRASIHGGSSGIRAGTYSGLYRNGDLWMSNTPDEARDHLHFLYTCEAESAERVLVNGLGLGMVVYALLHLPSVQHIDVVDIDADVIALVKPFYDALSHDQGKILTIYHDDAYTITWPRNTRWDGAWHDVWQHISLENVPYMTDLHRKYGRRVRFQDSWKRDELRGGCW